MKLKTLIFILLFALTIAYSTISIKNIEEDSLSGFSALTGNAIRTIRENNITLAAIIFFLIVLVGIAVLEYLGYPVMNTIKSRAQSITKKFKK